MTLSHLFKFANRLTLSTLRNQEGRISSASYRASRISKIGSNKQHQEFSYEIASVSLITFPLLASSLMLLHLSREKYIHGMFQELQAGGPDPKLDEYCSYLFLIQEKIYFSEKRRKEDLAKLDSLYW